MTCLNAAIDVAVEVSSGAEEGVIDALSLSGQGYFT